MNIETEGSGPNNTKESEATADKIIDAGKGSQFYVELPVAHVS